MGRRRLRVRDSSVASLLYTIYYTGNIHSILFSSSLYTSASFYLSSCLDRVAAL